VEIAVAAGSIPPEWYSDDLYLITLLDVLNKRSEAMKKRSRK
jgi:hypothetical protein